MSTIAKREPRPRRRLRLDVSVPIMLAPFLFFFFVFIILPIVIAVGLSFTSFNGVQTPEVNGLSNYVALLTQDTEFLRYILPNTLKFAMIVGPFGYLLQFLLAWVLAQIPKGSLFAVHDRQRGYGRHLEGDFHRRPKRLSQLYP